MTSLPPATEGTRAVLCQGIRDVSRKGALGHGHSRGVGGSAVHGYSRFRLGGGCGVCTKPGGGGRVWGCVVGVFEGVQAAGWWEEACMQRGGGGRLGCWALECVEGVWGRSQEVTGAQPAGWWD